MSIEPSNVRTVCIRAVMPPKPEPKIKVPLSEAYYAELLAEDAKRVRARSGKNNSRFQTDAGAAANRKKAEESKARRAELEARIVDLVRRNEVMTRSQLIAMSGAREEPTRHALQQLRLAGVLVVTRHGSLAEWRLAQEAAE